MNKKQVVTINTMHTCPMTTGNTPHVGGPIIGPGCSTATLNGIPIALQGDKCICAAGGQDVILQGCPTATINGVPIALQGSPTAHGGTIPAGVPGAVIITKNTSVLGSGAEGEPAVYNLQWVKEEQIIRNSKIEKVVTLVADARNIPNGEEVTVKVHTPEQDGGSSMLTELKGIVQDNQVQVEWKVEQKNKVKKNKRILAVKTIECWSALDTWEGNENIEGVISGGIYTFRVKEYQGDIPTEEEKKNITWLVCYTYKDEFSSTGTGTIGNASKRGDTFVFEIPENIVGDSILVYAYFLEEQKENEGVLQIPIINTYHVIVGFEVKLEQVFIPNLVFYPGVSTIIEDTLNFGVEDVGHTFFYIVKNNVIQQFFSFGPIGKKIKRAYGKGTPDYHLPDETRLFKIPISSFNYDEIMRYTQEAREAIVSGDDYYNIFNNYTCASSTKEILDKVIPEKLPNGRGSVAALNVRLPANVTHPYAWYLGFFNSEWMKTEKVLPADEKGWEHIMEKCRTEDKPQDPYVKK